jgi:sulfotransferase 6B1
MSYQAYDVARLHGRDLFFFAQYLKEKLVNGNRQKYIVLCNSYPKSGTHLLYQILYSIPGLNQWDDLISVQALCGMINTADHIRWKLGSAPNKSIVRSHLTYCKEILNILTEHNCRVIFIYRDLRDVVVSHANWVCREKRIFLHDIYQKKTSFQEQLMSSIEGIPLGSPFGSNVSQPSIGQDFSRWRGWVNDSKTLAVKFEDLVGERGGGEEETRLKKIEQIVNHLKLDISPSYIKTHLASHILNPRESHTFVKGNKGKIGNWQNIFTEEHKKAFKKVAGDLLIELGYEQDQNW